MKRYLDGWGEIAAWLSEHAGFDISKGQARSWSARVRDPLPVRRVGRLKRRHVLADARVLQAWSKREFA